MVLLSQLLLLLQHLFTSRSKTVRYSCRSINTLIAYGFNILNLTFQSRHLTTRNGMSLSNLERDRHYQLLCSTVLYCNKSLGDISFGILAETQGKKGTKVQYCWYLLWSWLTEFELVAHRRIAHESLFSVPSSRIQVFDSCLNIGNIPESRPKLEARIWREVFDPSAFKLR